MNKVKVLILGSGGREHALAEAIAKSPYLDSLTAAPGNPAFDCKCLPLDIGDVDAVVEAAQSLEIDLVVVGPELPAVAGVADGLSKVGIPCFGPSKAAAQLEGSKEFCREFARRHNIPGPKWQSFTKSDDAIAWLDEVGVPVVVKADGLAAGKGVIVPESRAETVSAIRDMLDDNTMGDAGSTILLEERLFGEEISVFAIADGEDLVWLGTAQDHKRVGEGDTGLNTGGMGAFGPVPGVAKYQSEIIKSFLEPVVQGMAAEGNPYVGTIFGGLMLTDNGLRLIEYNCRFGDPEAQVIIPMVSSDFLELLYAAAVGDLKSCDIEIESDVYSAAVVVAAKGYPVSNKPGATINQPKLNPDTRQNIFYSGVSETDGTMVVAGGRVATATSLAATLPLAIEECYQIVDQMVGAEMFARQDIGHKHYERSQSAYERAGVSIDAGAETTRRIAASVKSTHNDSVVSGLGSFGGVLDVTKLNDYESPMLVASTDGVGTKTMIAEEMNMWEGIGQDIVNHCVNDVLVQGAKPLFFMDTVASAKLDPEVVGRVVDGMAEACRSTNCVLLGGETAEMGDLLTHGGVDVSGTLVGVVEKEDLLPNASIQPGHLLIGMASSGLHTNGYSLARKTISGMDLNEPLKGAENISIGEALLAPHRSYLQPLNRALQLGVIDGLAHITGGGLIENLPRVLPEGCGAVLDTDSWATPALFDFLVSVSGISNDEAYRVFNMGVGMILIVDPLNFAAVEDAVDEELKVIGEVTSGSGVILNHG